MTNWLFDTTEAITGRKIRYSGNQGQFFAETNSVIRESIQKQPWTTISYFTNEQRYVENFIQRYHAFITRHCEYEWGTEEIDYASYIRNFSDDRKTIFIASSSTLKTEEKFIDEFKRHSKAGDVLIMFRKL